MKTILIVEDEPALVAIYNATLHRTAYRVLESTTADEAILQATKAESIDILLADVTLPGRSGIDVALEIREMFPNLKVVIVTGLFPNLWSAEQRQQYRRLAPETVRILQKPFRHEALLQAVEELTASPCRSVGGAGTGL